MSVLLSPNISTPSKLRVLETRTSKEASSTNGKHSVVQQSVATHVSEAQTTVLKLFINQFVLSKQDSAANVVSAPSISIHVGLSSQHSDAAHSAVTHLILARSDFKCFAPCIQLGNVVPNPSISSHVGCSTQHWL